MTLRPKRRKRIHIESYNIHDQLSKVRSTGQDSYRMRMELTAMSFRRNHEDADIIDEIGAEVSIGEIVDHAAYQYKHAVIVDFNDEQWEQYEQHKFIQRLST